MHISKKNREDLLYKNILLLARNKLFYTKFNIDDTFQNRINLIFLHISFLFIKVKHKYSSAEFRDFYQKTFDLIFYRIDQNMRELGYGDVTVNANMKFLVKTFYNILLYCENFDKQTEKSKNLFLSKYLNPNNTKTPINIAGLIDYFNKYHSFCLEISSDSVLRGNLNFVYK